MTLKESMIYNSGIKLDEGLTLFRESRSMAKALDKMEDRAEEELEKSEFVKVKKFASNLRKFIEKYEKIEFGFSRQEMSRYSAKSKIKKLAPEFEKIGKYAKENLKPETLKTINLEKFYRIVYNKFQKTADYWGIGVIALVVIAFQIVRFLASTGQY